MVIEASGTDSTLADGTGITGPRRTGGTALVHPDTTLVSFRDAGRNGAEPTLEAWHVGARGAVRAAHFGTKPPAEMRAWLKEWLNLEPQARLARLHDQVVRARQSAEVAAEKEPDWDKAAELQGEANTLEGARLEIEAELKAIQ